MKFVALVNSNRLTTLPFSVKPFSVKSFSVKHNEKSGHDILSMLPRNNKDVSLKSCENGESLLPNSFKIMCIDQSLVLIKSYFLLIQSNFSFFAVSMR